MHLILYELCFLILLVIGSELQNLSASIPFNRSDKSYPFYLLDHIYGNLQKYKESETKKIIFTKSLIFKKSQNNLTKEILPQESRTELPGAEFLKKLQ